MSVFTPVEPEVLSGWLKRYAVGSLVALEGIAEGIENTNYFVTTTQGRFVLTLFEKLTAEELPFYLGLMAHLADHGVPSARPIAALDDRTLGELNGKPAALVGYLPGRPVERPTADHCAAVGNVLAEIHLAGRTYAGRLDNPRGPRWWRESAPRVSPFLSPEDAALLKEELRVQSLYRFQDLPRGAIHGDLFLDNVFFQEGRVSGVIDFYFACTDVLLYDVAIAVNDWCLADGPELDEARAQALLAAYHAVRPLSAIERGAWPVLLRAAALRFWISRLLDLHFPRPGLLTHAKDPDHCKRILQAHVTAMPQRSRLWV
ncbi:MAG: homoserine kinase [Pseudomonadota bacterium]